jgi:hypothetical protein
MCKRELEKKEFEVFAALYEEATSGWVWLSRTAGVNKELKPHRAIWIKHGIRKVYCECRLLDENLIEFYNSSRRTKKIDPSHYKNVLIIGDWYRSALDLGEPGTRVDLVVDFPKLSAWAILKAGCHHPDPNVRLSTKLGIIGVWLGIAGILYGVFPEGKRWIAGCLSFGLLLLTLWVGKGIRRKWQVNQAKI